MKNGKRRFDPIIVECDQTENHKNHDQSYHKHDIRD